MKAYRVSVNLKLGLIVFAVAIAVASLWYTNDLVDRLREREASMIQLWAEALAQVPKAAQEGALNPYLEEFRQLDEVLASGAVADTVGMPLQRERVDGFRRAVAWAQGMPPSSDLTFILDAFLEPNAFGIPAVLVDSTMQQPIIWRNVDVGAESVAGLSPGDSADVMERLHRVRTRMLAGHDPIPIDVTFPAPAGGPSFRLMQYMLYGESALVTDLRRFPFVQLLFVALFVLVGYLGFSYVRRSEQSSLWVGMAKEAAHQLGTPISSLMGWLEVLRMPGRTAGQEETALDQIGHDIGRLHRVTSRFSDIGSLPRLQEQPVEPVIRSVLDYMQARLPSHRRSVALTADVEEGLAARLNAELFEWVIENLVKNALDAIDSATGEIRLAASRSDGQIRIDVRDTGKGIDRRSARMIFRPGYSTKKRGWGLGLSLAKRIVEDYHGGTLVLLQSRPGSGSTFRIEIPGTDAAG
jgi:hypothetical protein